MSFAPKKFEDIFEEMKGRSPVVSDFEVGSVARTLFEAFSYELALLYEKMDKVYLSGFVDTAEGVHLEKVVAVLGISRGLPDFATGKVEFIRDTGKEDIIIPPGTLVATEETTSQEKKVYQTIEEQFFPKSKNQISVRIQALNRGEGFATGKETITVMPRPIPGVKTVVNKEALEFNGKRYETDGELRERAKSMLISSGKATSVTIENAVLALPGVKSVMLKEYDENLKDGEHGVVTISVDGIDMDDEVERKKVEDAVNSVKAAGIFVRIKNKDITGVNGVIGISLNPELNLSPSERLAIEQKATNQIVGMINKLKSGEALKFSKLITNILSIEEIEDVEDFEFVTTGASPYEYSYATNKEIDVSQDDSLGFTKDNFMCVAADPKPLPVDVEIKFSNPKADEISKGQIIQKIEGYFKKLNESDSVQSVESNDLISLLKEDANIEVDSEYLILKAEPWCPSSSPQVNLEKEITTITPSFMERPFLGKTFLYTDHLEVSGAIKVSFSPDTKDERKEEAFEKIMDAFNAYLDSLEAEENLQFESLSDILLQEDDDYSVQIETSDFRVFKREGELIEEVPGRVKKNELQISSYEKARLRMINSTPCLLVSEIQTKYIVQPQSLELHIWIAREHVPPSYLASLPPENNQEKENIDLKKGDVLFDDIERAIMTSVPQANDISRSDGFYEIDWERHYKDTIAQIMAVVEYTSFQMVSSGRSLADGLGSVSEELKSRFHVRSVEDLEIRALEKMKETDTLKLTLTLLPEAENPDT